MTSEQGQQTDPIRMVDEINETFRNIDGMEILTCRVQDNDSLFYWSPDIKKVMVEQQDDDSEELSPLHLTWAPPKTLQILYQTVIDSIQAAREKIRQDKEKELQNVAYRQQEYTEFMNYVATSKVLGQ